MTTTTPLPDSVPLGRQAQILARIHAKSIASRAATAQDSPPHRYEYDKAGKLIRVTDPDAA